MSKIFLSIINMSISASYVILAVLLLRFALKKAPKWLTVFLWGIVGLRLVFPFSIESKLSLIPSAQTVSTNIMTDPSPTIHTGIPFINSTLNPIITESFTPAPGDSANPLQIWIPLFTAIWIIGIAAMLIYTFVSFWRLRRNVKTAVLLRDGIYQSENVSSPFVLGLIKPKIYLPFAIDDKNIEHVVAHEEAHIRRKDHLWKPLGFLLLTLHWFNPLLWLGYILLCRDIELACDEKVIKKLNRDSRADYSQALLTCSVNRRMISACPLAFGEVSVKRRIKSVLNYKTPAFWLIIAAILTCVAVAVCFLTDPLNNDNIDKDSIGIQSISAKRTDTFTVELELNYSFPTGGYGVGLLDKDEGEYCGDGITPYDGSLGEYRILIDFGDTEPSDKFAEKYPAGKVVELESSPIKIRLKRVHPNDHGFVLYVGFDRPISIEEVPGENLNTLGGAIKIPVNIIPSSLIYGSLPPAGESDIIWFNTVYDSATFDVDGDGFEENCVMRYGYTSGLFTFIFSVKDALTGESECETVIYSPVYEFSFVKGTDGITRVQATDPSSSPGTRLFDISIVNGVVNLTEHGVPIGEIGIIRENNVTLIYDAPMYSFTLLPSLVPSIEIENGVIYTTSEGNKKRLGTVIDKTITASNFDEYVKGGYVFNYAELVKELRTNNQKAYEVIPDTPANGIELYYIMEQKNGEKLIVYGHYENGEKIKEIRFIYSISP